MLSSVAFAADMAIMPPPAYAPAPVVEDFGGWYLRGDIGFSNQRVGRLNNALDAGLTTQSQTHNFNTAGIFGLGVGYKVNNWFRADITGEYRGNSQYFGKDNITYPGRRGYRHLSRHQERVGGAGQRLCRSRHLVVHDPVHRRRRRRRAGFHQRFHRSEHCPQRRRSALPGLAYGDNHSKWNLAWALHAGVAYKVTPNFTVELAYRYLDMGDGLTGDLRTFDGTNNVNNPMTFKNITSHDLKLGVRWDLSSPPAYAPPLMRKG